MAPDASSLPAERPLLVYDGDCGFCLRWVERIRRPLGDRLDYEPFQTAAARHPRVPVEDFARAVHLIEPGPDGRVTRGAEAVFGALARASLWRWPLWLYRFVPGVRPVTEGVYGFVAGHRQGFSRLDNLLVGPDVVTSEWMLSRRIVLRSFAFVAAVAFLSLWVQVQGLMGSGGIAPAASAMEGIEQYVQAVGMEHPWWQHPTLLWLSSSDAFLSALCGGGLLLSLLVGLGVAPAASLLGIWLIYLSFTRTAGPFLQFQWDTLLIEMALVLAFYAPWRFLSGRGDRTPPALGRWLLWFLLFRFMFESGVVKLTSGDPTWADLTAMTHHYWTQPLPHAVSWYVHHLPEVVHKASAAGMFFIELVVPFCILAPRRVRHLGVVLLVGLQVVIGATGNYGFFGLLTVVLCLGLVDDQAWRALAGRLRARGRSTPAPAAGTTCGLPGGALPPFDPRREHRVQRLALVPFAFVVAVVGGLQLSDLDPDGSRRRWSQEEAEAGLSGALTSFDLPLAARLLEVRAAPFLSVNSYGLFRVMTTSRPEIVVEGTLDGETWVEYPFRWKPGDLDSPPGWVQPHMPRLDWRLWFEALAWEPVARQGRYPYSPSPWFRGFLEALMDAEPTVLGLLASDPFPDQQPMSVRATLHEYRFTDAGTRRDSGAWWNRTPLDRRGFQYDRR
jgi:predicted DCC family thiol-disulfide oxidoreductase YuxK